MLTKVLEIAAVVVPVVALLITWLWRLDDRQSKTLDYRVISDTDIVVNRPEKLKVVYGPDEVPVKDPRVTEIQFKNTGNQVIEKDDFLDGDDGDGVIMRRPNARILDFDVVEESENHLVELEMPQPDTPEQVKLFPRTLNSGDWFTVQLVYDGGGSSSDMVCTTRIKGQTRKIAAFTAASDVARRRKRVWMAIAGFGLGAILICASIVIHFNTLYYRIILLNAAFVCFAFGMMPLVDLISTRRRERA
jgi:hypothetical protein